MSILLVSRFAEQLDGRLSLSCSFCPEVGEEPTFALFHPGAVIGSHRPFYCYVVMTVHGFADSFYNTYAWRKCKAAYKQKVGGLCERCLKRGLIKPGTQVHHKIRITPENMMDPSITLSFDNLELLCDRCHEEEHGHQSKWRTDKAGRVEL